METIEITLNVNHRSHTLQVAPEDSLLGVLRDQLGLVGAREGCGIGMCGACTVLLEGRAVSSCLLLAVQAQGKAINTIEGLEQEGELHPVQQAFLKEAAFQCAYCTPGFILSAVTLLAENPDPSPEEIRTYLAGNLCRCGSYPNIEKAVRGAAEALPQPSLKSEPDE